MTNIFWHWKLPRYPKNFLLCQKKNSSLTKVDFRLIELKNFAASSAIFITGHIFVAPYVKAISKGYWIEGRAEGESWLCTVDDVHKKYKILTLFSSSEKIFYLNIFRCSTFSHPHSHKSFCISLTRISALSISQQNCARIEILLRKNFKFMSCKIYRNLSLSQSSDWNWKGKHFFGS